ncbi:unnamed protein product [Pleuronectes platessa]|uniref:Uncharacterized protein n=1 Tax=Pleuronectes platessa TaxID=8262 RepID=A0A9N7U9A3_PLEPL|nr:unnamed protein product [Pleuronectes platessa]
MDYQMGAIHLALPSLLLLFLLLLPLLLLTFYLCCKTSGSDSLRLGGHGLLLPLKAPFHSDILYTFSFFPSHAVSSITSLTPFYTKQGAVFSGLLLLPLCPSLSLSATILERSICRSGY